MGLPSADLRELGDAVLIEKIPLEIALKVLTSNVASIVKLPGKGQVAPGMDADIMFLDKDMKMVHLLSRGKWVVRNREVIKKGVYEV
jgi:beta-aspartyl-dipeptidase (metallo-type)